MKQNLLKIGAVAMSLLAAGTTWVVIAQGTGYSNKIMLSNLNKPPVYLVNKRGSHTVGKSQQKYRKKKKASNRVTPQQQRQPRHRPKPTLQSTPKTTEPIYKPLSLHVIGHNGKAIRGVELSIAIVNNSSPAQPVQGTTDSQGNLDLSTIGPLPTDLKVFVADQAKWSIDGGFLSFTVTKDDTQSVKTVEISPVSVRAKIKAPVGAKISSPALIETTPVRYTQQERPIFDIDNLPQINVLETGEAEAELPMENLEEGAVPIVVSQQLSGGNVTAVVDDYDTSEPEEEVTAPPLHLANVNAVKLANSPETKIENYADSQTTTTSQMLGIDRQDYLGVLSTEDQIKKHNRELGKRKTQKMDDESQWWFYDKAGIGFKMRKMPSLDDVNTKKMRWTAERVRITSANGSNVGGVSVGDNRNDVIAKIGEPQIANDLHRTPSDRLSVIGAIDTYMDGGLRINYIGDKVNWIDVARPNKTMLTGTSAFVPRERAAVYIDSFQGNRNSHSNIRTLADFKKFLSRNPSIQIVDNRDDADLTISASVLFEEPVQKKILDIIPEKYSCTTVLNYTIYDENTGEYIVRNRRVRGFAEVNLKKDIIAGGIGSAIAGKLLGKEFAAAGIIATFVHAKNKLKKAASTCPPISVRQAFNNLTQEISQTADFDARVIDIDYNRGLMTLNIGSDMGVHPSTADAPFEFRIDVGGIPLGDANDKDGRHADYYDAVVRSVTPTSCVCEFQHVEGLIQSESQIIPSKPDTKRLATLPDPVTGLITAQATVNFPSVEVFTDRDLNIMETQLRQRTEAKSND